LGKTDNKELSRNAMVIKNNLDKDGFNQLSNSRLSKTNSQPELNKLNSKEKIFINDFL